MTILLGSAALSLLSLAYNHQTNLSNDSVPNLQKQRRRGSAFASRRDLVQLAAPAFLASVSAALAPLSHCQALSPDQAAQDYDSYAKNYDALDGGTASSILGIDEARGDLLREAKGRVLEIGVGTGLNLDKYDSDRISSLTLVDISDGMLQEARQRAQTTLPSNIKTSFVQADATSELVDRFGTGAFDTVVDSFSLCVMGTDGAQRCLEQMAKVLAPNGQVLLLENSRSNNPLLGLYQDATADAAASMGGKGCVYNQDVRALIQGTGLLDVTKETPYSAALFWVNASPLEKAKP